MNDIQKHMFGYEKNKQSNEKTKTANNVMHGKCGLDSYNKKKHIAMLLKEGKEGMKES